MTKLLLATTLTVTLAASAGTASAASCGPRADIIAHLAEKYAEAPIGIGLARNGGLIELLVGQGGSTWTLIETMPSGQTCLLADGEEWQPRQQVADGGAGV